MLEQPDDVRGATLLERALERHRGAVLGLTTLLIFGWSFLRAPTLRIVSSWIVLFDMIIVFTVLTIGQKMMAQWTNLVAKIVVSMVMIFWAFIFVREAIHVILFLLLNGTQPTSPL